MSISTTAAPRALPWYRVGTMWLVVLLLASTVIGSFGLVATALRHPDVHLVVPDDVPRPSKLPPIRDHGERASALPADAARPTP